MGVRSAALPSRGSINNSLQPIYTIMGAMQFYTNITSVTLTPIALGPELFTEALRALGDRPSLSRLTVDRSCMEEPNAHVLAKISGLRKLELEDPTQTILNLLPE